MWLNTSSESQLTKKEDCSSLSKTRYTFSKLNNDADIFLSSGHDLILTDKVLLSNFVANSSTSLFMYRVGTRVVKYLKYSWRTAQGILSYSKSMSLPTVLDLYALLKFSGRSLGSVNSRHV